ncbi:hypothetical protein CDAR_511401 [Caerostris darwini]|uniref:Uncharacterized protein n=1 Tax=Caerostris darwini TaxID=1538125 RepID=A0AAV4X717_9ARAC|nr:hypothetical protein CDAR_511401 [Caerostris darwini]
MSYPQVQPSDFGDRDVIVEEASRGCPKKPKKCRKYCRKSGLGFRCEEILECYYHCKLPINFTLTRGGHSLSIIDLSHQLVYYM